MRCWIEDCNGDVQIHEQTTRAPIDVKFYEHGAATMRFEITAHETEVRCTEGHVLMKGNLALRDVAAEAASKSYRRWGRSAAL